MLRYMLRGAQNLLFLLTVPHDQGATNGELHLPWKGPAMKTRIGWSYLALLVLAPDVEVTVTAAMQAAGQRIAVGFEQATNGTVLDGNREQCAQLMGAAKLSAEAKHGRAALDLGGSDAKGVADLGTGFALSKAGTIDLWCKPRKLSGILVGKYGAINIEFVEAEKCVRFGLKLKKGVKGIWVSCRSPERSVKANQWVNIKASWGREGLLLFLGGRFVGRAALPGSFDWFSEKGRFVLGSYTWPPSYAVWFFDGLIDDFSFQPAQEPPPVGVGPAKSSSDSRTRPAVLKLLLRDTPRPNYGAPVPAKISGRVTLPAKGNAGGVAGVSVTDGYSVARTDAQGAYTLTPSPDAVFIYITKPAGYDVVGPWYQTVTAQVDFTLKTARDEGEYTFVHVTDTHISTNRRSVEGLSRFVREVNSLTPTPRFVVNSGDLVNLDKTLSNSPATGYAYFRNYVGTMNHLAMPYYNVAGDHTDSSHRLEDFPRGDHRCGKALYWEYLGPNFFSFEYGKIHFVSVDFTYHLGKNQIRVKGKDREYPTNKVQPMHVEWLKQDMAQRTEGAFVVTTAEHDLSKFCPGFVGMARGHDVRLQLTGDDHIVAHEARPVPYRTGGSLSGCWWNPKCGGRCPDLSPQGYLLYHVSGEKTECFYKGLGQRIAITSHRVGAPWRGAVTAQAHVAQPRPNEALEYTLDGKDWQAMRETGQPFYRAVYEATIDSSSLPDGMLDFRVRSTTDDEVRSRVFVIANGRTPVPAGGDARLTFKVNPSYHVPKTPDGKVDVIFNDKAIGVLVPKARKKYAFQIPASALRKVNILSFSFARPDDGMGVSAPVLTWRDKPVDDPRHAALRQVRTGHWGAGSAEWGGFIVGDGGLREGPFARKQNTFCFVLTEPAMRSQR